MPVSDFGMPSPSTLKSATCAATSAGKADSSKQHSMVFIGFSPRRGIPGFAPAAAARAALENLAAGLALEWGKHSIRSVCVVPGNIETEGLEGYGAEALEESRRQVPLGRLGRAEEVGELIAFLASDGGAYVSGTSVVVDGGLDAWGVGQPGSG